MIFNAKIFDLDFSRPSNVSGFYVLGNFSGYSDINIQCSWVGLNSTDGYVKYAEKDDSSVENWNMSKNKLITLTSWDNSAMIKIENFNSNVIGLYIETGNITSGVLTVWVTTNNK